MANGLLVASNAAEALRNNIAEEQQLYSQFVNAVRSIVQPIQTAIAIVQVTSQYSCDLVNVSKFLYACLDVMPGADI